MSKQLLNTLNGYRSGRFHDWLTQFEGEPRIAWYPSAGTDFRDLLYLHPNYSARNPARVREPQPPDIFLHTDYYPWQSSRFLDSKTIYRDNRTKVYMKYIEELPRCDITLDERIVDFPNGSIATGRVIFLDIEITSSVLGNYSYPVVYAFVENAAFCAERMLPNNACISHIVHVRFGGGLGGGGKSTGVWLLNVLRKLRCEVFVTDSSYGRHSGDVRIYELYPELSGDEDQTQLEPIRTIDSNQWSEHGDVSWNLIR